MLLLLLFFLPIYWKVAEALDDLVPSLVQPVETAQNPMNNPTLA